MNAEEKKKVIERARACATNVAASGHICAGCPQDSFCGIFNLMNRKRKWAEWEKAYFAKYEVKNE